MTEYIKKITDDLIFYQKYDGQMTSLIKQLPIPLSEFNPETRLVTENGMYIGGLFNLRLRGTRLWGNAYIDSYVDIGPEDKANSSIPQSRWSKLFCNKSMPERRYDIMNEGKKYSKEWRIEAGDSCGAVIISGTREYPKLCDYILGDLRAEAITKKDMTLSNELLDKLFTPTLELVVLEYSKLMNVK